MLETSQKLLIFDFDGTIADTSTLITSTMQQTLEALQMEVKSREECSKTIGLPLADCFRAMFPLSPEAAQTCADTYRELFKRNNHPDAVPPFPGVLAAMQRLQAEGHILTVATSRSHQSVVDFLQHLAIEPLVSYVLGADDVERAKPDPCPVMMTLSHFGFAPSGNWRYDVRHHHGKACWRAYLRRYLW